MKRFSILSLLLVARLPSGFAAVPDFEREVRPFLKQHCYSCHDAKKAKAGFRVDELGIDFLKGATANNWREVIDQINSGEMPPDDQPSPSPKAAFAVVEWVGAKLKEAEREARISGGRILMPRLNRQEYAHTVGDLFQIDPHFIPKLKEELPADGKAEGFDRIGSALFFDQTQMTKYLEVAALVASEAVRSAPPPAKKLLWEAESLYKSQKTALVRAAGLNGGLISPVGANYYETHGNGVEMWCGEDHSKANSEFVMLPPGFRPNLTTTVTEDGYYRIRAKGWGFPGERGTPIKLEFTYTANTPIESRHVVEMGGTRESPGVSELMVYLRAGRDGQQVGLGIEWNGFRDVRLNNPALRPLTTNLLRAVNALQKAKAGNDPEAAARLTKEREVAIAELKAFNGPAYIHNEKYDLAKVPRLFLDSIEVEGPLPKQWPPASDVALGLDDAIPKDANGLRTFFARLVPRAYRRPVEPDEVARITKVATDALRNKLPFPEALRTGVQTMLCSPGFVFIQEPQPAAAAKGTRPLNDFELANRLSYFLWSSMPDNELFALAGQNKLRDPATRRAQVARMLADPKSRRFVENFAGQWLDVELFGTVEPSREYKAYDAALKMAGREEPLAFFAHVLAKNLPVTNFIDSDFLVINERLAAHYGIDGVTGGEFRPVALKPEHHRGGVLGISGLLTLLSDGTRTLPVRRAAWVLEKLLNDPPPPPPPNAGGIQPNTAGKNLTVRERLSLHRAEPNCASCHTKLDPYGLALENYDAIGAWRDQQNGEGIKGAKAPPIDASGSLKSGRAFRDLGGFKAGLLAEQDRFLRAFTEKLLTYALGRPVGYVDHTTVDTITAELARQQNRIQPLIQAVVASEPFQTK